MQRLTITFLLIALLLLAPLASEAAPAGGFFPRAFSYQGQLNQSGNPHDGAVELTFTLWDSEDGGSQFGNELIETVESVSGLFQVELDFGHQPWDEELWLQIEVDGQILFPRQPITAVPLASMALDVSDGRFWRQGGDSGTGTGDFLGTTDNAPFEIRVDGQRAMRIEPSGDPTHAPNIIGGLAINSVAEGVVGGTIAGGGTFLSSLELPNTIAGGNYGTISGGSRNTVNAGNATIGGGSSNTANGSYATVGGGRDNQINGSTATIAGGAENAAHGTRSTVGGGFNNSINSLGRYATIPGGRSNVAGADYTFAAGWRARAVHDGAFVWADATDADFESTGENQFLVRAQGGSIFRSSLQADDIQLTNLPLGNHPENPQRWTMVAVSQEGSAIPELHFHGPEHIVIGDPGSVFKLEAVLGKATFGRADKSMDLTVHGEIAAHERVRLLELDGSGSTELCLNAGNYVAACSSSARYKQEIHDLEIAGGLLEQLRPVSFRWIDSGNIDIGLIAEEVAEIDPRLVTVDADGQIEGVKYRQLSAVLIRALQEQREQTARVQSELAGLMTRTERMDELAERNARLEARLLRLETLLSETGLLAKEY